MVTVRAMCSRMYDTQVRVENVTLHYLSILRCVREDGEKLFLPPCQSALNNSNPNVRIFKKF
jgi:hypothetical protein